MRELKAKAGRAQPMELEGHCKEYEFYSELISRPQAWVWSLPSVSVWWGATSTSVHLPWGHSQVFQEETVIGQALG